MTTETQIEANQSNALLSTGAVTIEGKAVVSRNATKHGIFTKDLMIKSKVLQESETEYEELLNGLIESLTPEGQIEGLLVEKIAIDFWRLRRVIRFETGSIKKYLDEVLAEYYSRWNHFSEEVTDQKIMEEQSYIDWNKRYLSCLKEGIVTFDQPIWKGMEIESDIEDNLYRIANGIERKFLSKDEGEKLSAGLLGLTQLKEVIARAGYITDQQIADGLIKCFEKLNMGHQREIEKLDKQRIANGLADKLNANLCSLPPCDSLEKALKYEKSIQKSIFQNLIMLKKLQGIF